MKLRLGPLGAPSRREAIAMQFFRYVVALGLSALPLGLFSCSPGSGQGRADGSDDGAGGGGGTNGGGASGASGTAGTGAIITQGGSGGSDGTGGGSGACVTCTPKGGTYCGQIGDDCGGSQRCCPAFYRGHYLPACLDTCN